MGSGFYCRSCAATWDVFDCPHCGEELHLGETIDRHLECHEKLMEAVKALVGSNTPWPLRDVLKTLADAAEHLLKDHDCDAHGYENVDEAVKLARQYTEKARELGLVAHLGRDRVAPEKPNRDGLPASPEPEFKCSSCGKTMSRQCAACTRLWET